MRLAHQLADLPESPGRARSTGCCTSRAGPPAGYEAAATTRPGVALPDPATWPDPAATTTTYHPVRHRGRAGVGPSASRLTHRSAWLNHGGPLPVIEGTLIGLQVDHLPGDRDPKPVWLWCPSPAPPRRGGRLWQAFLRRFDLEHTFRLFNRSSAGPPRNCVTRPPLTDGPGSSSPAMPSSGSPGRWRRTCACPGNGPPRPGGSPRPGSAAGSGHPPGPALPGRCAETRQPGPDGRQVETGAQHPARRGKTTKRDASPKARRERAGQTVSSERRQGDEGPGG